MAEDIKPDAPVSQDAPKKSQPKIGAQFMMFKNRTVVISLTFALVFYFLTAVIFFPPPPEAGTKEILIFGSGVLFGSINSIVSFFFPSQQDDDK